VDRGLIVFLSGFKLTAAAATGLGVRPQEGFSRVSPKQAVYRWLIHHGFVEMRVRESHAAFGSWWWLVRHRRRFCGYGASLANLLHRLHETVLEPGFTETDLGFLNHAVPRFLREVGPAADAGLVAMLVQLHDAVPAEQRPGLTWHPDESLRRVASATLAEPGAAPDPAGT
jgi:hypothetical protein